MKRRRPSTRVILNAAAVWELLDRLDLSQNELARLASISPSHFSYLVNGARSPSPRVRRQLQKPWEWTTFTGCSSSCIGTTMTGEGCGFLDLKHKKSRIHGQLE